MGRPKGCNGNILVIMHYLVFQKFHFKIFHLWAVNDHDWYKFGIQSKVRMKVLQLLARCSLMESRLKSLKNKTQRKSLKELGLKLWHPKLWSCFICLRDVHHLITRSSSLAYEEFVVVSLCKISAGNPWIERQRKSLKQLRVCFQWSLLSAHTSPTPTLLM